MAIDLPAAVRRNREFGRSLGWYDRMGEVLHLLRFDNRTPSDEQFALAVEAWQRRQTPARVNGTLDADTWARMEPLLLVSAPNPQRVTRPAIDVARAVRRNRELRRAIGWDAHAGEIVRALGVENYPPTEQEIAEKVADWQWRHPPLEVDGALGPRTWAELRTHLRIVGPHSAQPDPGLIDEWESGPYRYFLLYNFDPGTDHLKREHLDWLRRFAQRLPGLTRLTGSLYIIGTDDGGEGQSTDAVGHRRAERVYRELERLAAASLPFPVEFGGPSQCVPRSRDGRVGLQGGVLLAFEQWPRTDPESYSCAGPAARAPGTRLFYIRALLSASGSTPMPFVNAGVMRFEISDGTWRQTYSGPQGSLQFAPVIGNLPSVTLAGPWHYFRTRRRMGVRDFNLSRFNFTASQSLADDRGNVTSVFRLTLDDATDVLREFQLGADVVFLNNAVPLSVSRGAGVLTHLGFRARRRPIRRGILTHLVMGGEAGEETEE